MLDALMNRTTVLTRPGVGALAVTARRWAPSSVHSIMYRPEGGRVEHVVPEPVWEQVLSAGSFEEIMALIRSGRPLAE